MDSYAVATRKKLEALARYQGLFVSPGVLQDRPGRQGQTKAALGKAGRAIADWLAAGGIARRVLVPLDHQWRQGQRSGNSSKHRCPHRAKNGEAIACVAGLLQRLVEQGKPMGDIMALSGQKTVRVVSDITRQALL